MDIQAHIETIIEAIRALSISGIPSENKTQIENLVEALQILARKIDELTGENAQKDYELAQAKIKIEALLDMLWSPSRERFTKAPKHDPNQLELFPEEVDQSTVNKDSVSTNSLDPAKKKPRKERSSLWEEISDRVKTQIIEVNPSGDLTGLTRVGTDVFTRLRFNPGHFVKEIYHRHRYVDADKNIVMGDLPPIAKNKIVAGPRLLSHVIVNKYVSHLPIERTRKQFRQAGVELSKSTMGGWIEYAANKLAPLYRLLCEDVLNGGYVQADETRIPVYDRRKSKESGKHHTGYYWVYSSPERNAVVFEYQNGRSRAGPEAFLKEYQGALQSDGYVVYDMFEKKEGITLYNCWAHARRYFYRAKDVYPDGAKHVLHEIRKLYAIERKLRNKGASPAERKEMRQEKALPILDELKTFLDKQPAGSSKCPWWTAVQYTLNRWNRLKDYTANGRVEMDNNLVENRIRAIALGRKNYLFCGSHAAAQRGAILYSLLSTCELHGVPPSDWLEDVLSRIPSLPPEQIHTLLPYYYIPRTQVA